MKKIPLRKCIGCNNSKPKKELIRIVKTQDESICIDKTSKLNGRGAYICNNLECFDKMVKIKSLEREFSQKIEQDVYNKINEFLKGE